MIRERDPSHQEQIERWARFVRENPHTWKKEHTKFIDAIFQKQRDFDERLLKTPGGKEKLSQLQKLFLKQ